MRIVGTRSAVWPVMFCRVGCGIRPGEPVCCCSIPPGLDFGRLVVRRVRRRGDRRPRVPPRRNRRRRESLDRARSPTPVGRCRPVGHRTTFSGPDLHEDARRRFSLLGNPISPEHRDGFVLALPATEERCSRRACSNTSDRPGRPKA